MAKRIQIRRDTSTIWTTANPILGQGEFGFEIDTKKIKIGDGTTEWNSLDYFGGTPPTYQTVTISIADWSGDTTCTKSVTGVTATTDQFYSIPETSRDKVIEFDIRASGQGDGTITFTADSTPDAEVTIIVKIQEILI